MKNKKIGYKLSNNFKCQSLTYVLGKTYSIDSIDICDHGFHYCENPLDTLIYYSINKDSVLLRIEDLGDELINEGDKTVSNKIKILEVVDTSTIDNWPIREYDENNNLIYSRDSSGFEKWNEFDENNNLIHFRDSNGFEEWKEFDENNNLIHYRNSSGFEEWKEFDENNNLIYSRDSSGYEKWNEFDENNNLIHYRNSNGFEDWKEFDENNNLIHYRNSNGFEDWNEFDENNNLIHYRDSNGSEWRITIE